MELREFEGWAYDSGTKLSRAQQGNSQKFYAIYYFVPQSATWTLQKSTILRRVTNSASKKSIQRYK